MINCSGRRLLLPIPPLSWRKIKMKPYRKRICTFEIIPTEDLNPDAFICTTQIGWLFCSWRFYCIWASGKRAHICCESLRLSFLSNDLGGFGIVSRKRIETLIDSGTSIFSFLHMFISFFIIKTIIIIMIVFTVFFLVQETRDCWRYLEPRISVLEYLRLCWHFARRLRNTGE